jgi:formate hydrogenlyase transcriptional activator
MLTAQRDPKALFHVLASELRRVVAFDGISIVIDDEGAHKTHVHMLEIANQSDVVPPSDLTPEETMSWWVYQHQQPLVIPFVGTETRFPRMMAFLKSYGIQSACGLPLTTVHRRLGGLSIGSAHPNAYSEEEVCFLSLVADHVALVIDDALNFEDAQLAQAELQRNNDRLKLILDVTNSLVSNLELRELLRAISASVRRVMHCDVVGVALPDVEGNQLRVYALDFPDSKGFVQEGYLLPIEGSPMGTVFQTGKPLLHNRLDPVTLAPEVYRVAAGEGFASGCTLPLISRNHILGTLSLGRRQEHAFSEDDVDFLTHKRSCIWKMKSAVRCPLRTSSGQVPHSAARCTRWKPWRRPIRPS